MRRPLAATFAVVLVAGARLEVAALDPGSACLLTKRAATSKKAVGKLKCAAAAVGRGAPVAAGCLSRTEDKFLSTFAKAERRGGCFRVGDAGAVEATVDACVDALRQQLDAGGNGAGPPSRCSAAKLKATGTKLGFKLKCWTRAIRRGGVDPDCLTRAETKFLLSFGRAESRPDCRTENDADAIETTVDGCVSALVAGGPAPTTTTTTVGGSTTTTSLPPTCGDPEPATLTGITAGHNAVRAGASPAPNPALAPLCWSSSLGSVAQTYANRCLYAHSGAAGLGENLYAITNDQSASAASGSVALWAQEASSYNYANNTCAGECGHYTQIVWRSTATLGCGVRVCTTGSPFGPAFPVWTIVVCNYSPAGNVVGQRPY